MSKVKITIELPDGATNGDVIQALWKGVKIEPSDVSPVIDTDLDGTLVCFINVWWDDLYVGKAGL